MLVTSVLLILSGSAGQIDVSSQQSIRERIEKAQHVDLREYVALTSELEEFRRRAGPVVATEIALQSNQAEENLNELLISSFSEFIAARNVEKALPIFVYFPDGAKKNKLSQILGQCTDEKVIARLVHADLDWKVRMNRIRRDRFEYGSFGGVAALYQRLVGNPGSGSSVQLGGVTEELLAPHRRILEDHFPFLAELEGSETRKAKEAATRNPPEKAGGATAIRWCEKQGNCARSGVWSKGCRLAWWPCGAGVARRGRVVGQATQGVRPCAGPRLRNGVGIASLRSSI